MFAYVALLIREFMFFAIGGKMVDYEGYSYVIDKNMKGDVV